MTTVQIQTVFGGLERAEYEDLTRELTGFCYRMLGSPFDAEDARPGDDGRGLAPVRRVRGAVVTALVAVQDRDEGLPRHAAQPEPPGRAMDLEPPSTAASLGHAPAPTSTDLWVLPMQDGRTVPVDLDPAQQVLARETVRLAFVAALRE